MPTNPFEPPKEMNERPDPMRDPTHLEMAVRVVGRWVYRSKVPLAIILLLSALMGFALWHVVANP